MKKNQNPKCRCGHPKGKHKRVECPKCGPVVGHCFDGYITGDWFTPFEYCECEKYVKPRKKRIKTK